MRENIVETMEDKWEQRSELWTDEYSNSDSDYEDFDGKSFTKCRFCGKYTKK